MMSISMQALPGSSPGPIRRTRPRRRWRWLRNIALALVLILVAGSTGLYLYARRSLPRIAGNVQLPGLTAPVTVYRDEWGVPHIVAQTRQDLYRAQGYVTAQDRLWEMDLSRRAAGGRLSEVLGASQVETDKFLRSFMLRRSAELSLQAYTPWGMEALNSYAAGVNAYIDEAIQAGKLPIEFTILGYKPEPWTPVDSLSIGKFMAYDLGGNWEDEIYHYQLRQLVGDEMAKQLFPTYPADGITIIKKAMSEVPVDRQVVDLPADSSRIDVSGLLAAAWPRDENVGSNNWVVSGRLTATGKPLLANDPHLGVRTPAIWYQTHLVLNSATDPINVIGVVFPGAPGIVIGHNEHVAWGVTNVDPDVQDLYIERRNPENPYQFEYEGRWEDATVYPEPIKVKGGDEIPFEVVVTRHGPIISEVAGSKENRPQEALALKWTAHMPTPELEGVLLFNQASNWTEFREALRKFQVPTQNFVFAANDGTIAYRSGGIVPIRAQGDGTVPVPGYTGTYEWTGFIPFDEMPEVVNPPDGFIVTANNKVIDDSYPYLITTSWSHIYRADRITEVLQSKTGFTADDMQRLQTDYANLQARQLLPILLPAVKQASLSQAEQGALALLADWDMVESADQGAPLVYHLWWKHLNRHLYKPIMGDDLFKRMKNQGNVTDEVLHQASLGNENDWVKKAGGLAALSVESFKSAVAEAVSLQGKNPAKWQWGAYHQLGPEHPIGAAVAPLGWFLNAKRYPIGGSNLTVGAMTFNRETGMVSTAAPWRQVVDLADIAGNSRDVVTPGQSGHFLSKWYDSQSKLHATGQLHPQVFAPGAYEKGKKLTLTP